MRAKKIEIDDVTELVVLADGAYGVIWAGRLYGPNYRLTEILHGEFLRQCQEALMLLDGWVLGHLVDLNDGNGQRFMPSPTVDTPLMPPTVNGDYMIIRCIVAVENAAGEPDLFFVKVQCTQDDYDNGWHYIDAKEAAAGAGYSTMLAFDENDPGGVAMLPLFAWESASTVTVGE